jgi:hypothetical protein
MQARQTAQGRQATELDIRLTKELSNINCGLIKGLSNINFELTKEINETSLTLVYFIRAGITIGSIQTILVGFSLRQIRDLLKLSMLLTIPQATLWYILDILFLYYLLYCR